MEKHSEGVMSINPRKKKRREESQKDEDPGNLTKAMTSLAENLPSVLVALWILKLCRSDQEEKVPQRQA